MTYIQFPISHTLKSQTSFYQLPRLRLCPPIMTSFCLQTTITLISKSLFCPLLKQISLFVSLQLQSPLSYLYPTKKSQIDFLPQFPLLQCTKKRKTPFLIQSTAPTFLISFSLLFSLFSDLKIDVSYSTPSKIVFQPLFFAR